MTWFKVDDNLCFHPKVLAAGNGAMGGWIRLGAHCSQHETDGFATALVVNAIFSVADLAAIMSTGMLVALPDGRYEMHDYLKYNPSKAELAAKRAHWAERRGQDRRRVSHVVSHSDTTSDTRECLTERLTKTPGRDLSLRSDPDPESDPDPDSHRESAPRLKRALVPPAPPGGDRPESGYDLAKRVFSELWSAKYKRPFKFDPFDAGPKSEKKVLQAFGNEALDRGGGRAEEYARHWVKAYLRDHGDRGWLDTNEHPAKTLTARMHKFSDPPTNGHRVEAPAPAKEPAEPEITFAEYSKRNPQGAATLAGFLGKARSGT